MSEMAATRAIYRLTGVVVAPVDTPNEKIRASSMLSEAGGEYFSTLLDASKGGDLGIKVGTDFATSPSPGNYALFKYMIAKSAGEALQQMGYQGSIDQLGANYVANLTQARTNPGYNFGTLYETYVQQLGGQKFKDAFEIAYIKNLGAIGDAAKQARAEEQAGQIA